MYWLLIWLGFPLLILFTVGVYYLSPPEWTIIQKLSFCFTYFSIQFSSVAQLCPALCDPMDCSTPGFPVHYRFQELAQTHVHWVGDAIQPSHPLLSPSPPTFNLSQHQGLLHQLFSSQFFASGDQSIGVSASASVLHSSCFLGYGSLLTVISLDEFIIHFPSHSNTSPYLSWKHYCYWSPFTPWHHKQFLSSGRFHRVHTNPNWFLHLDSYFYHFLPLDMGCHIMISLLPPFLLQSKLHINTLPITHPAPNLATYSEL